MRILSLFVSKGFVMVNGILSLLLALNVNVVYDNVITAKNDTIRVGSQHDFDNLQSKIDEKVKNGIRHVEIIFKKGKYLFNDLNRLQLVRTGNTSITFKAAENQNVTISSDGEHYDVKGVGEKYQSWYRIKLKTPLDRYCTLQDENGNSVRICDSGHLNLKLNTNLADEPIALVDSVNKIARIKICDELSFLKNKKKKYFQTKTICFKTQWSDFTRKLLYSDDKYFYFDIDDWILKNKKDYLINMFDWSKHFSSIEYHPLDVLKNLDEKGKYSNVKKNGYQPYFILNDIRFATSKDAFYDQKYLYVPSNIKHVYVSRFENWIYTQQTIAEISFDGLNFNGTALDITIDTKDAKSKSIINLLWSRNITFTNCTFKNIGTYVVGAFGSKNLKIQGCKFEGNYLDNILSLTSFTGLEFNGNFINNPHKVLTSKLGMVFDDVHDAIISQNKILNVSRSFLALGWKCGNIVVENNQLSTTKDFLKYVVRNFSSDTGALVYSWGNSPFIVKNNVVHDLPSNLNFSGIMVDNGTGHANITGNLFYNIGDYCVNAWRNGAIKKSNEGNVLESNIILGKISYGGFDKSDPANACYSKNVFLRSISIDDIAKYATDKGKNVAIDQFSTRNGFIYLNKDAFLSIERNMQIDGFVRGFIKEEN